MTQPCILYAAATILLSWGDAMRIKAQSPKVDNIDHAISRNLATGAGGIIMIWWWFAVLEHNWWSLLAVVLTAFAFVGIRLTLFDPMLNIFRALTGTNPTGRIDYVSTETSSYEDQHSEKVGFWAKRIGGFIGWLLMFLLYKVIFKV